MIPSHAPSFQRFSDNLLDQLVDLGSRFIKDIPDNDRFKRTPDDWKEHYPHWHEFGIATHTRKVTEAYRTELPSLLNREGLAESVTAHLSGRIDGHTKRDLFDISIPLHDLGKFARTFRTPGEWTSVDYNGHEALSEELMRNNRAIHELFAPLRLKSEAFEYVARVVGLHYELGKFRDHVKASGAGFTIAYATSSEARAFYRSLAHTYPEYAVEIGLFYLVDTLGKVSGRCEASSDEELARKRPEVETSLRQIGKEQFTAAVLQMPVNVAVGLTYLHTVLHRR
jgi:hypothetical protein